MTRIKEFQKKMKQRSKFEVIKSIFQAITVTVVAVVAVTVFVPKSPEVSFDKVKAFSHEIIYQVTVLDSDFVIENQDLLLIAESQYDRVEKKISNGQNYGSIDGLRKNTKYNLKVVFNKGYGDEVLASRVVMTEDELVGAFESFNKSSVSNQQYLFYDVGVLYGNTEGYTDWQIRYTTIYKESEENELFYQVVALDNYETLVEIELYPYYEASFHLVLEAMFEGDIITLDEITIDSPFAISAWVYAESITDQSSNFIIYAEEINDIDITYSLEMYQNGNLIETFEINSLNQEPLNYLVQELTPDTEYIFLLKGYYTNPVTLAEEHATISEVVVHTLPVADNIIIIPNSPEAIITNLKVFENELIYQVSITDLYNAAENSELKVVLSAIDESYEQILEIGHNMGLFSGLINGKDYNLKVILDLENSYAVLAEERVFTTNKLIGAISDLNVSSLLEQNISAYVAEMVYGDVIGYTDWQIRYAAIISGFEEDAYYETIPLEQNQESSEVIFYEPYGEEFYLVLEAMHNGNLVIVDETRVKIPFGIYAYVYVSNYTDTEATLNLYAEVPSSVETSFVLKVFENEVLEESINLDMESIMQNQGDYQIYNLIPKTNYRFVLEATYTNPDTMRLETMILSEESIVTNSSLIPTS